jgi:hypothetical protein
MQKEIVNLEMARSVKYQSVRCAINKEIEYENQEERQAIIDDMYLIIATDIDRQMNKYILS